MERALPTYEMAEGVDPNALECSRLVVEPFALGYVTQKARRAMDTKKVLCYPDEVLWSRRMRPDDGNILLEGISSNLVGFGLVLTSIANC
jgi:hypothetical protein